MRILFVSPEVPGLGGAGIATYLNEASTALSSRGHVCHILTWHDGIEHPRVTANCSYVLHEFPTPNAKYTRHSGLDPDLLISSAIADWVIALHVQWRFDIIEGTDWNAPLYCLLQRRNVEPVLNGCRISIFNHGVTYNIARNSETFTPRSKFQVINLEHQCLNLADTIICPSEAARQTLLEIHGVASDKVQIIPEPLGALPRQSRAGARDKTLLYYGSVCVSKGLRTFLALARRVVASGPAWPVDFIGPIVIPARRKEAFLRDIVGEIGAPAERVEFSGPLAREDALQRIGEHHLLVNMSKRETFCYAFIEGLLRGAAPLTLAGSAQSEFIPEHLRATFTITPAIGDLDRFDPGALFDNWARHAEEVKAYARARSSPDAYCAAYERLAQPVAAPAFSVRGTWSEAPVSVLIPAHEPDDLLLETVASALNQTTQATEIVIGDDGSRSQRAREALRAAAQHKDVRVVNFGWRGLAETRNRLLRECRTPLFAFVDADDLLEPEFISSSRTYLSANYDEAVRSVQGWYELFGTQTGIRGPVIYQHFSHALWNDLKNNILGVTEVFREIGYNGELTAGEAEDWEFWLRYFRQGWQVRIVPEVLWRYRRHAGALSARWSEAMSLGTARANAKILSSANPGTIPAHVWDFIGEYMYLGETFFGDGAHAGGATKDQRKIQTRLSSFGRRGVPQTFRQRTALRLMRHLSSSLK